MPIGELETFDQFRKAWKQMTDCEHEWATVNDPRYKTEQRCTKCELIQVRVDISTCEWLNGIINEEEEE